MKIISWSGNVFYANMNGQNTFKDKIKRRTLRRIKASPERGSGSAQAPKPIYRLGSVQKEAGVTVKKDWIFREATSTI